MVRDDLEVGWWEWRKAQEKGLCVYIQLIHFVMQQKLIQHCSCMENSMDDQSMGSQSHTRLIN